MQTLVRVIKSPPRPRDKLEGICGALNVSIRVCSSTVGDSLNSYLHVGAGALRFSVEEEYVKKLGIQSGKELEKALKDLSDKISMDYNRFAETMEGPTIPGSSVKGNIRSRLELSFVPKGNFVRSCFIISGSFLPPDQDRYAHFKLWRKTLSLPREEACSYLRESSGVCLLCDLFGTSGLQSLVQFSDFIGKNIELHPINLPTGERFLVAPPGSTFSGKILFRNLKASELGLLLYGMGIRNSRIGKPVLLGRMKYRRDLPHIFGVIRYLVDSLHLAPFSEPFEVNDHRVQPGKLVSEKELDYISSDLIRLVQDEFSDELIDVNEVSTWG